MACALPLHGWQASACGDRQGAGRAAAVPPIQSTPLKGIRLANGMRLYLIEDHELPVVFGVAIWRGGSALDPADEPGLARLTATVLRTGGSRRQTGGEIDAALDNMGARITTAVTPATAGLSLFRAEGKRGGCVAAGAGPAGHAGLPPGEDRTGEGADDGGAATP